MALPAGSAGGRDPVAAIIGDTGPGRTTIALAHAGLGRADDVERWRALRKELPAGR